MIRAARIQADSPKDIGVTDSYNQAIEGAGNLRAGRDINFHDPVFFQFNFASKADRTSPTAVAPSSAFQVLADPLRRTVKDNLTAIQKSISGVPMKIVIAAQAGDADRIKLADELAEIFRSAGFDAKARSSHIISQEMAPIIFTIHPERRDYAIKIGKALGPMLQTNVALPLKGSESRPLDELHISLLGEPTFLPDGIAVFN